ncbi:MAG: Ig-like domain-containing protein, partial [Planctomycetes bacterium]|nr:Ig-like domain-containing protein [Planctomycetota bacterium]
GTDSTGTAVVKVYRNDSTVANTPPTIPTGLAAAVVGKSAALSWNASTDTQTPAAGLTYNLRVGTTPGGQQVKAPMADLATGLRRIPASGNAQQNLSWTLKKLPPGTYYWSVQAIDNGFLASGWSAEASFTVTAPVVPVIPTVTAMAPAPGANLSSKPASISITLSAPIDPATVGAATVKLVGRGVDGLFGTADDVVLTPASIGVAGSVITLDLTGVTMPDDLYRVTLDGTPTPPATFANLFARWKMTEGTGGTLPDSSGNGRNGTLNGATWGSGLFGNALVLAGGGGRVDIDAGALTPDWSAAMWVCRTAATAGIASSLMDSNSTTGTSLRLEQYAAPNDVGITEYTVIDQGFGYVAPIGTWVHLTFVSDALTTQLYVNGVFESSAPRAYNLHVDKIGTARTIATHSPYCLLNDFQVYTRVLSPAEMTSLVTLGGCIKSTTGGILNGEYTGSFPSGDASPGGDFNASFGINIPSPPTAFTMTEPANGSIGVSTLPTFTWNSSVGATSYRIQVATDAAFLFPVEDQVVVGTSFTPASGLAFSNAYYWRVTANNLAGGTLATGAPFLFTTGATIDLLIGGCGLLGAEVLLILALLRRRIRSA